MPIKNKPKKSNLFVKTVAAHHSIEESKAEHVGSTHADAVLEVSDESDDEDGVNEVKKKSNKERFYSWFKPSNFSLRLSDTATFAILYDTVVSIICVSNEVNTFLSVGIPAMVNGALSIAPPLIPFAPNLFSIFCRVKEDDKDQISEADKDDNKYKKIFHDIQTSVEENKNESSEQLKIKLERLNIFIQKKLDKLREYNESGQSGLYDDFINSIYLLTRAVGGALIILKACNAESEEVNDQIDEINKWLSVVSNTAYLAYMFACYIPKTSMFCFRKAKIKKDIQEDVTTVLTPAQDNVSANLSVTSTTQTLFSSKEKISSQLSITVPNDLSAPLLNKA